MMRFDAMLGKSSVGVQEKIKEPTLQEAKCNIERLERSKRFRKPYPIPAASLINSYKQRAN